MNSLGIYTGGSNTDSGSQIRVQCRDTTNFNLAFIIRNLILKIFNYYIYDRITKICFQR